jgi:hypothetical protein
LQHLQNLFVFGDHLFKLRQAVGIDISGDLQTMARRKQDANFGTGLFPRPVA